MADGRPDLIAPDKQRISPERLRRARLRRSLASASDVVIQIAQQIERAIQANPIKN